MHNFDPTKKITKVEVIIGMYEMHIQQINFYHHQQRLVKIGESDDDVKQYGGRKETFEIGNYEQLIGC